ncbi:MAG: hypothetical protein GY851_24700 [bacterium]|nr:hypothetical protein [bacterium]
MTLLMRDKGRFPDPRRIGYVLGGMIGFQVIGALAGLGIGYHHDWFMNAWLGGALATLPGFVFGAVFHFRRELEPREAIWDVRFVGALAIALTAFALWPMLPNAVAEMRNLDAMEHLQSESITRIDVFDDYGETQLATITSPEALDAFGKACADAESHSTNHPTYTDTWCIVVTGSRQHEFEFHLQTGLPDHAVGDFVDSNSAMHYFGTCKSRSLRPWVEEHLVPLPER